MSQTFYLVCLDAQAWVWIGQGWVGMTTLYTSEPAIMAKLQRFLNTYRDKEIRFICSDTSDVWTTDGWHEFEAEDDDG